LRAMARINGTVNRAFTILQAGINRVRRRENEPLERLPIGQTFSELASFFADSPSISRLLGTADTKIRF
jgi:hypothetical protein